MSTHVSPTLRHISFRALGTSEIHLRFLENDPELQPVLGMRARNVADLVEHAPLGARRLVPPAELGQALLDYAQRHGASAAAMHNARAIASGEAQVVITGQQPGLFGGPLYSIHKAATTVRLAREINAKAGGPKVVPVFWNHSDDHDLDETNRAFFVNPNQDLQRFRLDVPHAGESLREVPVGRALERTIAAVDDLLTRTEFREAAIALFTPRHPDERMGDGMARLLFQLFAEDGLLVIEPRDLPASAFEVLPKWRAKHGAIRSKIRELSDYLADLGFEPTIDPATPLMFHVGSGQPRTALADDEPWEDSASLSPGMLLRPLWQDAIFPTAAFVVGPGELSYLAIVGGLYKLLGVPRPVFVPRASLTLVEPSLRKHLDRFGWDIPQLAAGAEALASALGTEESSPAEGAMEGLLADIATRCQAAGADLRESDPSMVGPLERARHKVTEEIDKLLGKLRNARQNRQGTGLRQIRRLCANLRPRGRVQERVLGILPFLVSHGNGIALDIIAAADPFGTQHGVLEL
jgi:uncharacterized protein YllA (UPF0747 family)